MTNTHSKSLGETRNKGNQESGGTQLRASDAPTVSVVLEASDPSGGLIAKSCLTLVTP